MVVYKLASIRITGYAPQTPVTTGNIEKPASRDVIWRSRERRNSPSLDLIPNGAALITSSPFKITHETELKGLRLISLYRSQDLITARLSLSAPLITSTTHNVSICPSTLKLAVQVLQLQKIPMVRRL